MNKMQLESTSRHRAMISIPAAKKDVLVSYKNKSFLLTVPKNPHEVDHVMDGIYDDLRRLTWAWF